MSGGGGGNNTTTSYQYQFSPEMMPYASKLLGVGSDITFNTPYQAYSGQRVADFSPLQNQAFGNIQGMQPSAYTGQAGALAGLAGTNQFSGANVNQFMNPYVSSMQQDAIRNYSKQLPTAMAGAARAGALGGSRSAILEAEGQRGLQQQLQGIQANAFESARDQFNKANANQLAAAGMLGNLGQQEYQQASGINQALLNVGALQQAQQQQALNNSYNQFQEEKNYPMQQLMNYSSILRGVPMQNVTSSTQGPQVSTAAQALGLATSGAGLYNAFGGTSNSSPSPSGNKAAGGAIKSYKGGGIVSLAGGGISPSDSTHIEKMGAINASLNQLGQSMPPQQADAQVQQTVKSVPDSVDWQTAYDMLNYTKTHPVNPPPVNPDSVVVQMAKQIAQQADAKKMSEMQQAQQAQQQQMAMQQMQQAQQAQQQPQQQMPQQGVAGLPTPNVGQNYTDVGITAPPQDASDQQVPVMAASGGGIADLQSNVGKHYADGGIVAFEDGGNVKHYAGEGPSLVQNFTSSPHWGAEAEEAAFLNSADLEARIASAQEAASGGNAAAQSWLDRTRAWINSGPSGGKPLSFKFSPKVAEWATKGGKFVTAAAKPMAVIGTAGDIHNIVTDPNADNVEKGLRVARRSGKLAAEGLGLEVGIPAGVWATEASAPFIGPFSPLLGTAVALGTAYAAGKGYDRVLPGKEPDESKIPTLQNTITGDGLPPPPPPPAAPVDVSKYFTNASSSSGGSGGGGGGSGGGGGYSAGLIRPEHIKAPDVMEGIEKPKSREALIDEAMQIRDKYGIGASAKHFMEYLDKREAELAGDEKFSRGMALANAGFKMLSTPGQFAQSLGAGGQQYAQDMMALKKEENAAKLGLYQARMQAESAIEQGKAGAIDSAMNRYDTEFSKYINAKQSQAGLIVQVAGINQQMDSSFNSNLLQQEGNAINRMQAANAAAYQGQMVDIARANQDLERQEKSLVIAFNKAAAAGDEKAMDTIAGMIKQINEASTSYLKGADTNRKTLMLDGAFNSAYTVYTNPESSQKDKLQALAIMKQRAQMAHIDESEVTAILTSSRGTLQ